MMAEIIGRCEYIAYNFDCSKLTKVKTILTTLKTINRIYLYWTDRQSNRNFELGAFLSKTTKKIKILVGVLESVKKIQLLKLGLLMFSFYQLKGRKQNARDELMKFGIIEV